MQKIKASIEAFLGQCQRENKPPLLVLLGPTASGKTALSLELAEEFGCEIISSDSRQVYRHMDIGTDKILADSRRGIPHFLIDVVNPDERFTVADFKCGAETAAGEILARGKLPMLVGGTGLYIRAVTQNFKFPEENKEIRVQLEADMAAIVAEKGRKEAGVFLHKKLGRLDPASAAKIHPRNIPYVVRALEIFLGTGRTKDDRRDTPKYSCLMLGLSFPREKLFERIDARVETQIERGLVEETKKLLAMGYGEDLPSMRSLGYREIIQHLEGALTIRAAAELIKKNTRDFAKRQMTWFKKDAEVTWICGDTA